MRSNPVNRLPVSLSTRLQRVFLMKSESSGVTLKGAGSLASFTPSHCCSLSAGHAVQAAVSFLCFFYLVSRFLSVFSTTRFPGVSLSLCLVIFQSPATAKPSI